MHKVEILRKSKFLFLITMSASLILISCTQVNAASVLPNIPKLSCHDEIPGAVNFVNESHGYCLVYPEGYDLEEFEPGVVAIYWGSLIEIEHPKAFIVVENAHRRKADKVADAIVAAHPDTYIRRNSDLKIDGQAAVMLDGVPGQEFSRKVIVVYQDLLYILTFLPVDETHIDIYNEMNQLYKTVTRSFQFIPTGAPYALRSGMHPD